MAGLAVQGGEETLMRVGSVLVHVGCQLIVLRSPLHQLQEERDKERGLRAIAESNRDKAASQVRFLHVAQGSTSFS